VVAFFGALCARTLGLWPRVSKAYIKTGGLKKT
jgi:hypothetical protein